LPAAQGRDTAVFSPDGKLLATSSFQVVRVWSASDGTSIGAPISLRTSALTLTFSPDSQLLLTGGSDFSARLWSTATGQQVGIEIVRESTLSSLVFGPAGKPLLSATPAKQRYGLLTFSPHPSRRSRPGVTWGRGL
jgi:WD40 repeat protein